MKSILVTALLAMLLAVPVSGQVRSAINQSSIYSDTILRQLIRASKLAAERRQSLMNQSTLRSNRTAGIRRRSTFTTADAAHLDRLSTFAGDRLRSLEQLSEFEESEVNQMQAAYQRGFEDGQEQNEIARIADRNSVMPQPQVEQLLRASDARDWARQISQRATDVGSYADLLRRRSISSPAHSRMIERRSIDP